MDKREVVMSLAMLFDDTEKERSYTIEDKQIDKNNYKTLIVQERKVIHTSPEYESFISILRYYNTRDLNYIAAKLDDNKETFFIDFRDEERDRFLRDIRDLHHKLRSCNSKNIVFVEHIIVDWANGLFDSIAENKLAH